MGEANLSVLSQLLKDNEKDDAVFFASSNPTNKTSRIPFLKQIRGTPKNFYLDWGGENAKRGIREPGLDAPLRPNTTIDEPVGVRKQPSKAVDAYGRYSTYLTYLEETELPVELEGNRDIVNKCRNLVESRQYKPFRVNPVLNETLMTFFIDDEGWYVVGETYLNAYLTNDYYHCRTPEIFLECIFRPRLAEKGITAHSGNFVCKLEDTVDERNAFFKEFFKNNIKKRGATIMLVYLKTVFDYGDINFVSNISHGSYEIGVEARSTRILNELLLSVYPTNNERLKETYQTLDRRRDRKILVQCPARFYPGETTQHVQSLTATIASIVKVYKPKSLHIRNLVFNATEVLEEVKKNTNMSTFTWYDSEYNRLLEDIVKMETVTNITAGLDDRASAIHVAKLRNAILDHRSNLVCLTLFSSSSAPIPTIVNNREIKRFKDFFMRTRNTLEEIYLYNFNVFYLVALSSFTIYSNTFKRIGFADNMRRIFLHSAINYNHEFVEPATTNFDVLYSEIGRYAIQNIIRIINTRFIEKSADEEDMNSKKKVEVSTEQKKMNYAQFIAHNLLFSSSLPIGRLKFFSRLNFQLKAVTSDKVTEINFAEGREEREKLIQQGHLDGTHWEYLQYFFDVINYTLPKPEEF